MHQKMFSDLADGDKSCMQMVGDKQDCYSLAFHFSRPTGFLCIQHIWLNEILSIGNQCQLLLFPFSFSHQSKFLNDPDCTN